MVDDSGVFQLSNNSGEIHGGVQALLNGDFKLIFCTSLSSGSITGPQWSNTGCLVEGVVTWRDVRGCFLHWRNEWMDGIFCNTGLGVFFAPFGEPAVIGSEKDYVLM
jgi:hypothetical protein